MYSSREQVEIHRESLYAEIWSEPVSKVAPRYGISDVALKKICVKLNVPVPGRGYWAKLANGKSPRKKALPKLKKGELACLKIDKRPPKNPHPVIGQAPQAPQYWTGVRIEVGEAGPLLNSVVQRIAEDYSTATVGEDGLLRSRRKTALPFKVSEANRIRALHILDTLLNALHASGQPVEPTDAGFRCITSHGAVEFALAEQMKTVERNPTAEERKRDSYRLQYYGRDDKHRPRYYREVASGSLALAILTTDSLGVRKTWADGEKSKLEKLLTSFASGLVRYAETKKQADEEAERRRRAWAERERQQREEQMRRLEEQRRLEALKQDLAAWREAREVRRFATALEVSALEIHQGQLPDGVVDRLEWMRRYAERIDPLRKA